MGRNSKARRDARRRSQNNRRRTPGSGGNPTNPTGARGADDCNPFGSPRQQDPLQAAELRLIAHVRQLGPRGTHRDAVRYAESMLRERFRPWALSRAAGDLLDRVTQPALRGGWSPEELAEVVERHLGQGHRRVLAGVVADAHKAGAFSGAAWESEAAALGTPRFLDLAQVADLALAMRLAALFHALPPAPLPARRTTTAAPSGTREAAKLAQVRALLAKAEATTYEEEAEALWAKAQELISRYSLERLLEHDPAEDRSDAPTYRRLWLDAPYQDAKASLVSCVAEANRCRAIYDGDLAFCTVVGTTFDLRAIDLMVTSLLAQAQRAMLAHGSQTDRHGRSSTRSFRKSFLVSFAVHIGRRLREVSEESVAAAGSGLLPALRDQKAEVDDLFDQMFPNVVQRATSISNAQGWAGGRAAAELAQLGSFEKLG